MARKLSELDPIATLADADTFVMRDASADDAGGTATKAQVAAWLGGGTGYPARGTYAPTVTPNSGTTASASTQWVWTRIGNGAGVPAAGDVVSVRGKFAASRGVLGQGVVTFTLPFVASPTTSSGLVSAYVLADGTTLSALAGLDDANTGSVTLTDLEANTLVQLEITFQTANAVDP